MRVLEKKQSGSVEPTETKEEQHADLSFVDRAKISLFLRGDEEIEKYLRETKNLNVSKDKDGNLEVWKDGDKFKYRVDPNSGALSSDIVGDMADWSRDILQTGVEAAAFVATGGGSLAARAAAGGIVTSAEDLVLQKAGVALGIRESVNLGAISETGLMGAMMPAALHTFLSPVGKAAAKTLESSVGKMATEALGEGAEMAKGSLLKLTGLSDEALGNYIQKLSSGALPTIGNSASGSVIGGGLDLTMQTASVITGQKESIDWSSVGENVLKGAVMSGADSLINKRIHGTYVDEVENASLGRTRHHTDLEYKIGAETFAARYVEPNPSRQFGVLWTQDQRLIEVMTERAWLEHGIPPGLAKDRAFGTEAFYYEGGLSRFEREFGIKPNTMVVSRNDPDRAVHVVHERAHVNGKSELDARVLEDLYIERRIAAGERRLDAAEQELERRYAQHNPRSRDEIADEVSALREAEYYPAEGEAVPIHASISRRQVSRISKLLDSSRITPDHRRLTNEAIGNLVEGSTLQELFKSCPQALEAIRQQMKLASAAGGDGTVPEQSFVSIMRLISTDTPPNLKKVAGDLLVTLPRAVNKLPDPIARKELLGIVERDIDRILETRQIADSLFSSQLEAFLSTHHRSNQGLNGIIYRMEVADIGPELRAVLSEKGVPLEKDAALKALKVFAPEAARAEFEMQSKAKQILDQARSSTPNDLIGDVPELSYHGNLRITQPETVEKLRREGLSVSEGKVGVLMMDFVPGHDIEYLLLKKALEVHNQEVKAPDILRKVTELEAIGMPVPPELATVENMPNDPQSMRIIASRALGFVLPSSADEAARTAVFRKNRDHLYKYLEEHDVRVNPQLLRKLRTTLDTLHDGGLFHNDAHEGNFMIVGNPEALFDRSGKTAAQLFVIDFGDASANSKSLDNDRSIVTRLSILSAK